MNRRDFINILIILLWSVFWIFLAEIFCKSMTSDEIIITFACSLLIVLVCLLIPLVIKPFRNWGDKKLIRKNEK